MPSAIRPEFLQLSPEAAQALLSYGLVFLGAIVALVLSTSRTLRLRPLIAVVTGLSLILAAAAAVHGLGVDATTLFGGTLASDPFGHFFSLVFLASAAAVTAISYRYLGRQHLDHPEYYVLILFACLGMMLLASAQDLIVLFLGLELMSFSIYSLVGFRRNDRRSNEAALKYFILGSTASAVMLYGGALVYGMTQTLNLKDIWELAAGPHPSPVYAIGVWLLLIGFLFKVASVPFHMWLPDVYEGAPTPITAFMATGVKVAAFAAFLRLYLSMGPAVRSHGIFFAQFDTLIQVSALASMILGNLLAVAQTSVKRMLAYSSIAHTGYLLLGFLPGSHGADSAAAVMLYLVTYSVMTLGAFAVLTALSGPEDSGLELPQLSGLAAKRPGLAFALAVFLFSLAGLPPTAGFVSKYFLFYGAVQAGHTGLIIAAVLCSLVSVYYYLRVLVFLYMKDAVGEPGWRMSRGVATALAVLVVLVLQIGILPEPWLKLIRTLYLP